MIVANRLQYDMLGQWEIQTWGKFVNISMNFYGEDLAQW